MIKDIEDGVQFESGKKLYANNGYIGINEELSLSEGYDGKIYLRSDGYLTPDEMRALADHMIARWKQFKDNVK